MPLPPGWTWGYINGQYMLVPAEDAPDEVVNAFLRSQGIPTIEDMKASYAASNNGATMTPENQAAIAGLRPAATTTTSPVTTTNSPSAYRGKPLPGTTAISPYSAQQTFQPRQTPSFVNMGTRPQTGQAASWRSPYEEQGGGAYGSAGLGGGRTQAYSRVPRRPEVY